MKTLNWKKAALVLAPVLFTACNDDGGNAGGGGGSAGGSSGGNISLEGRVSAGPVADGVVHVYKVGSLGQQGELVGITKTDQEGNYKINVKPDTGSVVVVVKGGYYYEEASGNIVHMDQKEMK